MGFMYASAFLRSLLQVQLPLQGGSNQRGRPTPGPVLPTASGLHTGAAGTPAVVNVQGRPQ